MNKIEIQACPKCRHQNTKGAICCDLCGWAIVAVGMDVTIAPGDDSQITIAPTKNHAEIFHESNSATDEPKNHLADFKISEILGQGGMGAVYRAKDLKLERTVALKLFRTQTDTDNASQQLLDEARMACKLNHPNIVTIYDIARGQDSNFIVMEWVDGQSLDQLVPSAGLPVVKAMEYACQIADGISCAHRNGIIHRDIKAQNIMLTKGGRIKILDFGIAGLLRQQDETTKSPTDTLATGDEPDLTYSNGITGTPYYMSPEQALGQQLDQRTDIFSFGIVLYQMLCGKLPFVGINAEQLTKEITRGNFIPLDEHLLELAKSIVSTVHKMLAADKDERWQSSVQLAEEIHVIYQQMTERKNWWQRRHWLSKAAIVVPFMLVLGWSVKEVVFPPSTQELIERQLAEATKIAVLPFDNISGDPLLQIFNDGLAVALSNDLTAVGRSLGNSWVIPSTEIGRMKEPSVQKVSDKYGVDLVLTGSIQHMGSTRLLVLNLLNAKDGRQLKTVEISINADRLFQGHSKIRQQALSLLDWSIPDSLTAKFNASRPRFDGAYKEFIQGKGYLYRYDQAGNLIKAKNAFNKAIGVDRDYQSAYTGLAEVQLELFRKTQDSDWLDKMAETIQSLHKINPTHILIDYLRAELLTRKGKYQQAISLFQSSIRQDPKHIRSYIGLAEVYDKSGEIGKAEATHKDVIDISPNNWLGFSHFGVFYFNKGDYLKAISQFKRLSLMAPNNNYAFLNLAASYYSLGRVEEAIRNTKLAIQIQPSDWAYSNLATMYFYKNEYEKAVNAYEKAIELNTSDYVVWGNLADAYRFANNNKNNTAYERAMKLALSALELNPEDKTVMADLAYYFANLGQREQALKYARTIDNRNNGVDNFMVATAYELLGEKEKVLTHLAYAIEKNYPLEEIRNSPLLGRVKRDERFLQMTEIKNK